MDKNKVLCCEVYFLPRCCFVRGQVAKKHSAIRYPTTAGSLECTACQLTLIPTAKKKKKLRLLLHDQSWADKWRNSKCTKL